MTPRKGALDTPGKTRGKGNQGRGKGLMDPTKQRRTNYAAKLKGQPQLRQIVDRIGGQPAGIGSIGNTRARTDQENIIRLGNAGTDGSLLTLRSTEDRNRNSANEKYQPTEDRNSVICHLQTPTKYEEQMGGITMRGIKATGKAHRTDFRETAVDAKGNMVDTVATRCTRPVRSCSRPATPSLVNQNNPVHLIHVKRSHNRIAMAIGISSLGQDAGMGLYADQDAAQGTVLLPYGGQRISKADAVNRALTSDYVYLDDKDGEGYDAEDPRYGRGRLINDAFDDSLVNCKITKWKGYAGPMVVALTTIEKGAELLTSYGRAYWLQRLNKLSRSKQEICGEYYRLNWKALTCMCWLPPRNSYRMPGFPEQLVTIATSRCTAGGKGLFALIAYEADDYICSYTGKCISMTEVEDSGYISQYVFGDEASGKAWDAQAEDSCPCLLYTSDAADE